MGVATVAEEVIDLWQNHPHVVYVCVQKLQMMDPCVPMVMPVVTCSICIALRNGHCLIGQIVRFVASVFL